MISTIFASVFYFATAVIIFGVLFRVYEYWNTPSPLNIATTPAPTTQAGAAFRVIREVTLFESLFKSNKWIWILGIMFHLGLLLVLLRHFRYFVDPTFILWAWVPYIQPFGKYAAFAMVLGLAGLWARRFLVERVRYISAPSDHLMLLLLIMIGVTGLLMKFGTHTDIMGVKDFFEGLKSFTINTLPDDLLLYVHLGLVATLMIIFPFSKLLHVPGVFFSPTRNMADNPREKRHVAAWAEEKYDKAGE